jgi:hypothetical protein
MTRPQLPGGGQASGNVMCDFPAPARVVQGDGTYHQAHELAKPRPGWQRRKGQAVAEEGARIGTQRG